MKIKEEDTALDGSVTGVWVQELYVVDPLKPLMVDLDPWTVVGSNPGSTSLETISRDQV